MRRAVKSSEPHAPGEYLALVKSDPGLCAVLERRMRELVAAYSCDPLVA